MAPAVSADQAPVPPPYYQRTVATALHLDALTLVTRLQLLALCELAVHLAQRQCPPPLPAGPGGAPRIFREESLQLLALLRTLWRLSYQEAHDRLCAWPALAVACRLPLGTDSWPRVPSKAQQSKRLHAVGATPSEMLFLLLVRARPTRTRRSAMPRRTIRARCCAATGSIPSCVGGTGLPLLFRLSPANVHDAPFARPLLELVVCLLDIEPRVIRLDAGYWSLKLIAWIHGVLGTQAVIPWNSKRQKQRDGLPPTWTAAELGKRTSIERFFGRVLVFFRVQRPPVFGWSVVETRVALTHAAVWVIAQAAWRAHRHDLIRSPRWVLAYVWEWVEG